MGDFSLSDPGVLQNIVGKLIILILSVAVHEFGHAFIADRLGDRLPRQQGRVTLNPLAHADPIGTLLLPGMVLFATQGHSMGFGWGKPVQTLPNAYTRKLSVRVGHMFVAFAGPAMNFLFGSLLGVIAIVLAATGTVDKVQFFTPNTLASMLLTAVWMNYILMFFNLIPARPLDGGAVLEGILPDRIVRSPGFEQYQRVSIFIAAAFMFIETLRQVFVWPATQIFNVVARAVAMS